MSYGTEICPQCGGLAKVYEGGGGHCPNCGYWLNSSWNDGEQIMNDNAKFIARKLQQVCRGKFKVCRVGLDMLRVTVYNERDWVALRYLIQDYTDMRDGIRSVGGGEWSATFFGFNVSEDFDGYSIRPYRAERGY